MLICVAAGGSGTRMLPVTRWINKHLIPVGNGDLMIDMPLKFLQKHGFKNISIVTGSNHATQICEYVGDGDKYSFDQVEYSFQAKPAGIADILNRIGHRGSDDGVLLILGDNYFESHQLSICSLPLGDMAACWEYDMGSPALARSFGQVIRSSDGDPSCIVEKPLCPDHGRILTGLYYFPANVFQYVEQLTPSARGELEITALLDVYLKQNKLKVFQVEGEWSDLGEIPSWEKFIMRRNSL